MEALRRDKGVAGLTILLALVTLLFVIGLLVMIFALMGSELMDADSVAAARDGTVSNETLTVTDAGVSLTTCAASPAGAGSVIGIVTNATDGAIIVAGNYTNTGCTITATAAAGIWNNTAWNVSYTYTFAGESYDVINDTTTSIAGVTDWYTIFIVIAAMVVLILLTVIIITAIRGSGLIAGGSGGGNTGSA